MKKIFIKKFRDMRNFMYKIFNKKRIYYYPPRYLNNYKLGKDITAINPYRKIRYFNIELVDFVKNIKS